MKDAIFLGLGSNMGDRLAQLQMAVDQLRIFGLEIVQLSSVYETPPWGNTDQPAFLNAVAEVHFSGSPHELLEIILRTEEALGRVRTAHWGPRTIDIDILAFGNQVIVSQRLHVPHPLLADRAFVLVPWAEIAGDFRVVTLDASVNELLSRMPGMDRKGVLHFAEGIR